MKEIVMARVEASMHLRAISFLLACLPLLVAGCKESAEEQAPAPKGMTGRVVLRGTPPLEKDVALDGACARLQTNGLTTRHYVVGTNGGLANAMVFIKQGLPKTSLPASSNQTTITFSQCQLLPYVSAVRTGQSVAFKSDDKLLHNVGAVARTNPSFNLAMGATGQSSVRTFDLPEIFIRLKCDVHPWEYAHLSVFDHPYFAVTDANGYFEFPAGLPDGKYIVEARHLKAGSVNTSVSVQRGKSRVLELPLEVPAAQ